MSDFKDILKKPLPSQAYLYESEEDDNVNDDLFYEMDEESDIERMPSDTAEEGCGEEGCSKEGCGEEGCGEEGCSKEEDDDIDNMSDDEIADELDDIMDDDPDYPDDDDMDDDDDLEEDLDKPLEGEDDKKADELMAIAATPLLIKDELTAEECARFYESEDADIAVNEGLILESDIEDLFEEGVFASPNKPFKMTKKARFNQLYELSVQIEARMHNDPRYTKLQKVYAIERTLKKQLRKQYHSQAVKRAKKYLQRLMTSKSGILNKIGKKIGLKK